VSLKGVDTNGCVTFGIDRGLLTRILTGERVCLPAAAGAPHVCVFFAETDELLLQKLASLYPGEPLPPIVDLRKPVGEKP
jgi:hypothetical protein